MKTLYWIFPCYNEEACLPSSFRTISETFNSFVEEELISKESKLVFVDDGSKDNTWSIIKELANSERVVGLKLSRNKGHQYAVEAGLRYAYEKKTDFTITMDVDLQDDISVTKEMIAEHYKGNDIVYGVRNDRSSDKFFKKSTANAYYKLMHHLGVEMVENAADFRLISYRALGALLEYHEANLFLRGLVPQVGYPSSKVEYRRLERKQGETHYSMGKMVTLALDGVSSFSSKPISYIARFGLFLSSMSVLAMLVFMILNLTKVLNFSIFYYLFPFISLMTGFILLAIAFIGLYISKINIEVKKRPHYFIEEITGEDK